MVIDQTRWDEGGEDGRAADAPKARYPLAELRASKSADHHDGKDHRDLAGNFLDDHKDRHQSQQDQIRRQRNNTDSDFHQLPPTLGPEACGGLCRHTGNQRSGVG